MGKALPRTSTISWRFIFVQDVVFKLGETAIDFPPMQKPASFNLTSVKEKIQAAMKAHGD
jgi:arylsulfatase